MRRIGPVAILALTLAGCGSPLVSKKPLFESGTAKLKPGLWALLDKDCREPVDDRLFDWPSCAKPARVRAGDITVFSPQGPVRLDMVNGGGAPVILQVEMTPDQVAEGAVSLFRDWPGDKPKAAAADSTPVYAYLSFQTPEGSPATTGMLTLLQCPSDDVAGIYVPPPKETTAADGSTTTELQGCEAKTAAGVRAVARSAIADWPTWRAVWVADLPERSPLDDALPSKK